MIVKVGKKFLVKNEAGTKILGTHPTHEAAFKQLQAIEISKHAGEPGATQPKKYKEMSKVGKKPSKYFTYQ